MSSFGGDKRDRTADLLNAIQALSQLSYTPGFLAVLHTTLVIISASHLFVNTFFYSCEINLRIFVRDFIEWMGDDMTQSCGDNLVLAAAALAIQASKGLTPDQIATLAAFFTSFADNLALIAGQLPEND